VGHPHVADDLLASIRVLVPVPDLALLRSASPLACHANPLPNARIYHMQAQGKGFTEKRGRHARNTPQCRFRTPAGYRRDPWPPTHNPGNTPVPRLAAPAPPAQPPLSPRKSNAHRHGAHGARHTPKHAVGRSGSLLLEGSRERSRGTITCAAPFDPARRPTTRFIFLAGQTACAAWAREVTYTRATQLLPTRVPRGCGSGAGATDGALAPQPRAGPRTARASFWRSGPGGALPQASGTELATNGASERGQAQRAATDVRVREQVWVGGDGFADCECRCWCGTVNGEGTPRSRGPARTLVAGTTQPMATRRSREWQTGTAASGQRGQTAQTWACRHKHNAASPPPHPTHMLSHTAANSPAGEWEISPHPPPARTHTHMHTKNPAKHRHTGRARASGHWDEGRQGATGPSPAIHLHDALPAQARARHVAKVRPGAKLQHVHSQGPGQAGERPGAPPTCVGWRRPHREPAAAQQARVPRKT
jgi:hypothetical protein